MVPLSRPLHFALVALTIGLLSSAMFGVLAQPGVQDPPLYRDDAQDTTVGIGGHKPNTVLAALADPVWVRKDAALAVAFRYECITGYGANGAVTFDSDCSVGTAGGTSLDPRRVTLAYNTSGAQPGDSDPVINLLSPGGAGGIGVNHPSVFFSGSLPTTAMAVMQDGQSLGILVRVPLAGANVGCTGAGTGGNIVCVDPLHATKEAFYKVRVDGTTPEIVVNDPSNANVAKLTGTSWWLYSSREMSNLLPSVTVSVVDNVSGSPLDPDSIKLYRERQDNTTNFQRNKVSDHGYAFFYSYPTSGARPFNENTATRIDVEAKDIAGHTLDTRTAPNPAVWVIMDNTDPQIEIGRQGNANNAPGGSWLKRHAGETGLTGLGEPLRVYVNATDIAGRKADDSILNSPREILTVTLRFQGGPNNDTFSQPITIPWNATACPAVQGRAAGCFHTADARIPDDWVNGQTWANVTVSDPVGNSVSAIIMGSVNVDVSLPEIVPLLPLDATKSQDFTKAPQVTFRMRASDPGDEDEWRGTQTQDTDFFGVAIDSAKVRYKLGATGVLQTGRMTAQDAEDTFQWTNTFGAEETIYYYYEATDLAGNVVTYPRTGQPNVKLNVTDNGGRFLLLQVDQRGPAIEPAKDLAYLGKGPHELDFNVTDGGIGVDDGTVRMFWRPGTSGSFLEVPLTRSTGNVFRASIPTQEDGGTIQYYVVASDRLGNVGSLGSVSSPRTATIDLTAPSVTVNAPATATVATFNVTWSGTDTGSGVRDYTLQFRIAPGGSWFTVPTRTQTTLTYYEMCAATGKTYEFRVTARDRAGNERTAPEAADASTIVDAPTSCAKAPEVQIIRPLAGQTLSGSVPIQWSAVSTTSPGDLKVSLLIGSGNAFQTIAKDLQDAGTFTWNSASLDVTVLCMPDGQHTLRVVATDPNGLEGRANIGPITLSNGIVDCDDRDNDGLPDTWETAQFGGLTNGPDDDNDNDGYTNLDEFRAGTDPNDDSSRPRGGSTGNPVSIAGWTNWFILPVLGFVAVLAVFVIGMTRRW